MDEHDVSRPIVEVGPVGWRAREASAFPTPTAMAGLVPAIHVCLMRRWHRRDRTVERERQFPRVGLATVIHVFLAFHVHVPGRIGGWVYIMTNRRNGTLYIGVTNDLVRRVWEHREGLGSSFVRRYALTNLVYFERHEDIRTAIQRETSLKRWPRAWKVRLLASQNPEWKDLYPSLFE